MKIGSRLSNGANWHHLPTAAKRLMSIGRNQALSNVRSCRPVPRDRFADRVPGDPVGYWCSAEHGAL